MAIDYVAAAIKAKAKIEQYGREITISKLDATVADPAKPWRGSAAPTKVDSVVTSGLFLVPNTSIPTESRGLAFDWVDQELLKRSRHVCLVPAYGLPDLESYNLIVDDSKEFLLIWGQCFQPGPVRLFYVFGMAQ